MPETTAVQGQQAHERRKVIVGEVVSNKMQKTIVVEVVRKKAHPFYGRVVSKAKKFYAHDEKNEAHVGDVVDAQPHRVRRIGACDEPARRHRGARSGARVELTIARRNLCSIIHAVSYRRSASWRCRRSAETPRLSVVIR